MTGQAPTGVALDSTDGFFAWKCLKRDELVLLERTKSYTKKRALLEKWLQLSARYPNTKDVDETQRNSTRREIFLELTFQCLAFARQNFWSHVKTSTFFSIVDATHKEVCEVPGPAIPMQKALETLETHFMRHAQQRPPFSMAIFSHTDVKLAMNYLVATYLRHLSMYQFVFGSTNHLHLDVDNTFALVCNSTTTALEDGSFIPESQKLVEANTTQEMTEPEPEEKKEKEKEEDSLVSLEEMNTTVKSKAHKDRFEGALNSELNKMQSALDQKMKEQQVAFEKRMAELEAQA